MVGVAVGAGAVVAEGLGVTRVVAGGRVVVSGTGTAVGAVVRVVGTGVVTVVRGVTTVLTGCGVVGELTRLPTVKL